MTERGHLNGGAALVAALERNGVDVVFGIPGVHNLEIYRHLPGSHIKHVATRHEQGAGYAADGFARASGSPGVCLTTSGPGLTNACTAAATAYADSVPVLLCAPGPPAGLERRDLGLLHEMKDQHAHLEALAFASVRPTSAAEIGAVVDEVFAGWRRARRRPVHLELPVDVLEGEWEPAEDGQPFAGRDRVRSIFDDAAPPSAEPDGGALNRAVALLSSCRRPLVVLGGGARDAGEPVRSFVERLGALVVTTVNGKGTLPERHPHSLGAAIRLSGTRTLFESADVVVVVGSELGDSDLWGIPVRTDAAVVRVDIDPHQLDKNLDATVALCGDARVVLEGLLARLPAAEAAGRAAGTADPDWLGGVESLREQLRKEALADGAAYEEINRLLSDALPETTIVAGDSAQVSYFGTAHFWPMGRAGQFLYPTGYATLGYGLPSAIGAKLACADVPVVALVGDGGFLFTAQEILAAVEQHLAIPVVIVDNHGYAEIRSGMVERGIAPLAVGRPHVDFAALSGSLGGRGYAAGSVDELCTRVLDALAADGPTVISIDVSKRGAV